MMSEAYLKSRIEMNGKSDLPAWLVNEELHGMGKAALLNAAAEEQRSRKKVPRNSIWHLPRRKGVKS